MQLDLLNPAHCQRWRNAQSTWRFAGEPFDPRRYGVEPLSFREARDFVVTHHYSHTFPAARLQVGLFEVGVGLVGVAVFSVPCNQRVITAHAGLPAEAGVELGRFVLLDEVPGNAESWFLARAFRVARQELSGVCAVVSYSDPVPRRTIDGHLIKPGHIGTIYQASNAVYRGRGSARTLHLTSGGHVISPRTLSKIRLGERGAAGGYELLRNYGAPRRQPMESGADYVKRALAEGPFRRVRHPGNHCYVFGLTPGARRFIRRKRPDVAPYPKENTL